MLHAFINQIALKNAVDSALQGGATVYVPETQSAAKAAMREDIASWLESFGRRYIHWEYKAESYFDEMDALMAHVQKHHAPILNPGVITLGMAQLCIGLYLKFLWLSGHPEKMPLFPPFGNEVIKVSGLSIPENFQLIDTRRQIEELVHACTRLAEQDGYRSATIWEAENLIWEPEWWR